MAGAGVFGGLATGRPPWAAAGRAGLAGWQPSQRPSVCPSAACTAPVRVFVCSRPVQRLSVFPSAASPSSACPCLRLQPVQRRRAGALVRCGVGIKGCPAARRRTEDGCEAPWPPTTPSPCQPTLHEPPSPVARSLPGSQHAQSNDLLSPSSPVLLPPKSTPPPICRRVTQTSLHRARSGERGARGRQARTRSEALPPCQPCSHLPALYAITVPKCHLSPHRPHLTSPLLPSRKQSRPARPPTRRSPTRALTTASVRQAHPRLASPIPP